MSWTRRSENSTPRSPNTRMLELKRQKLLELKTRQEELAKKEQAPLLKWRSDPVAWASERLGVHLWSKQREIVESVRDNRLTAVVSCHGSGKSLSAALLTAFWLDVHAIGDARVVTTAPTANQVRAILWSEIHGLAERAITRGKPFIGRINETEWKYNRRLLAFGRKPSDHNQHGLQGIHARAVLTILDEAGGIVPNFWTAASAITTGEDCRILAVGNPDDPGSHFAKVTKNSRWNVIEISAFDTPNFTGEIVPDDVAVALVGPTYVEDIASEYGEYSPIYQSKVLGKFPTESDDGVVSVSALRACCPPEPTPHPPEELNPVELGVDLGAGGDETVIRERRGVVVGKEWRSRDRDPVKVTGLIVNAIKETGAVCVKVDSIGIGWGIAGRLRELTGDAHHARIIAVNVSESSSRPDRFPRLRSQLWWEVGRKLSEDRGWDLSHLDERDRDRLITQLTAPKYSHDSAGRVVVEAKPETKKRLGRSPDNADALLLAFYEGRGMSSSTFLDQLVAAYNGAESELWSTRR